MNDQNKIPETGRLSKNTERKSTGFQIPEIIIKIPSRSKGIPRKIASTVEINLRILNSFK